MTNTGFLVPDAGPPPAWLGTPQQFAWLEGVVKWVLVLNVVDAVLTLMWISAGMATEANPLLEPLVQNHPFSFVTAKLSMVSMGTLLLWRHRDRPLAVVATFVAFLAYFFLFLYHLYALDLRLLDRLFS